VLECIAMEQPEKTSSTWAAIYARHPKDDRRAALEELIRAMQGKDKAPRAEHLQNCVLRPEIVPMPAHDNRPLLHCFASPTAQHSDSRSSQVLPFALVLPALPR